MDYIDRLEFIRANIAEVWALVDHITAAGGQHHDNGEFEFHGEEHHEFPVTICSAK